MALASDIVVADAEPVNKTYKLIHTPVGPYVIRRQVLDLSTPRILRIGHIIAKKSDGTDKHHVGFSRVDLDVDGNPCLNACNIQFVVPRRIAETSANTWDLWSQAVSFITGGNLLALLNGES